VLSGEHDVSIPTDLNRPEWMRLWAMLVQTICGLIAMTPREEAGYNPWALLRVIIGVGLAIGVSARRQVEPGAHCAEVFAETVAILVLVFTLLALG